MNVFVLSTGRCASTTLASACKHISNYSSAHESQVGVLGTEKLNYPDSHIEIDNRLIWFDHQLEYTYGDNALYVHLRRERTKVAQSYCERWHLNESIAKAYGHGVLMMPKIKKEQRMAVCLDFVDFVEQNINMFLSTKSHSMIINTETIKHDFESFWKFINAQGNFEKAVSTFDSTLNKNRTSLLRKIKNTLTA